jgi:frataxin
MATSCSRGLVVARSPILSAVRSISTSSKLQGITPDNKPVERKDVAEEEKVITPANITDDEFHRHADYYLERLLTHLEELQDEREEVDVEYSVSPRPLVQS